MNDFPAGVAMTDDDPRHLIGEARSPLVGDPADLIARLADALEANENVMAEYSRALDEIYALRGAAAYEASVLTAHLGFKSFPKSRREVAAEQVWRLRASARGQVHPVYATVPHVARDAARKTAGMDECLTRASWEAEHTNTGRQSS